MHKLRILTYNVRMLPGLTGSGQRDLERCRRIGDLLAGSQGDYDVLCLQEVFDEDAREVLVEALATSHPHQVPICEDDGFLNQDSGLFFASKYPIADAGAGWRFREFSSSVGFFGPDFWVDKGVFVARIVGPDEVPVFVANTHMQSDGANVGRHASVRAKQLRELRQVMARALLRSGDVANSVAVLVGDLNVPGEDFVLHADGESELRVGPEYANLRQELVWGRDVYRELAPTGPGWTWDAPNNPLIPRSDKTQLRLDYGFVFDSVPLQSVAEAPRLRAVAIADCSIEPFRDEDGACLSDHFALDFTLEF